MQRQIIITIVFLFFRSILASPAMHKSEQKELKLHFDINKTIIATDAVQEKGLEETINSILAEFTFAKWNGKNEESYYEHITDKLATEQPNLSRTTELFKTRRRALLKEFPIFLKQFPKLLAQYEYDKACMLKILSQEEMVIFPAFIKTITWLNENFPNKYSIYLRTFGEDLSKVIIAIEKTTSLKFNKLGKFKEKELSLTVPLVIQENSNLYDFFVLQKHQHCAIQDDYIYWKSKEFQAIGGKPFPLDKSNSKIVSIFFDDNANDPDKPIICPIGPNNELEDYQELLKSGNIVAVNPKEAILDDNFFIKKIKSLLNKQKPIAKT